MKVIVTDDLSAFYEHDADSTEEDLQDSKDYWQEISDTLKKYTVWHEIKHTENGTRFTIKEQKIVLDEFQMNDVFSQAMYLLDYRLEYSSICGVGDKCDFGLYLYRKLPNAIS